MVGENGTVPFDVGFNPRINSPMPPQNNLFIFVPHWRDAEIIRQTADQVARQCCSAVSDCVRQLAVEMGPDMLRGYIRAYAVGFVADEVNSISPPPEAQNGFQSKVTAAAIEQLIELVIDDLFKSRPDSGNVAEAA
jgi:hypothetical protein